MYVLHHMMVQLLSGKELHWLLIKVILYDKGYFRKIR